MKNHKISKIAVLSLVLTLGSVVHGQLSFDQDVTPGVIFGSGNANGAFTVDRNNGVELGLRAKLRHNASGNPENTFNSNGAGTYTFNAGVAPGQSASTAEWSFEWSINTDFDGSSGYNLGDLTYLLSIVDNAGSVGSVAFDPINGGNPGAFYLPLWDHAIGDNSTTSGTSNLFGYQSLIDDNNVAQNSWKAHWYINPLYGGSGAFDPTAKGEYEFTLTAMDGNGAQLAQTAMTVAVVPEPATNALIAMLGLGAFLYWRKRRK